MYPVFQHMCTCAFLLHQRTELFLSVCCLMNQVSYRMRHMDLQDILPGWITFSKMPGFPTKAAVQIRVPSDQL